MKAYWENIQVIKIRNPYLKLLDPAEFLCDEYWCYAQKDGEPLYADDDHLSVFGSSFLAEKLINQIIK